jgi:phosphoribosylamine--glycine ligase
MRVLVVGNGGREHALVWKIRTSPLVKDVFCAPGNPGIARLADCVPIETSNIVELADFAQQTAIDLTVIGPELPAVLGLVDEFQRRGLTVFGPTRAAAELEGSRPSPASSCAGTASRARATPSCRPSKRPRRRSRRASWAGRWC